MRTENELRQSIENLKDSEAQFKQKAEEILLDLSEYLRENAKNDDDYCKIYKTSLEKLERFRYWGELLQKASSEKDTILFCLGECD